MKKKLALLLACTMALSLTACGGSKPAATTAAPETTTAAAAESSAESKADEKTEAAGGDMDALIEDHLDPFAGIRINSKRTFQVDGSIQIILLYSAYDIIG